MNHEEAFQKILAVAPEGAFVSVEKDLTRSRTGEISTEWVIAIIDANLERPTIGTGETFAGAFENYIEQANRIGE